MAILDKQQCTLICFLLAGIGCVSLAFECIPADGYKGCACYIERNSTKQYVNLFPLKSNSSSPRFTVEDNKEWFISYTPCGVFSEFVGENKTGYKPCVDASVARWTNKSTHICESLGDEKHVKFKSSRVGDHGGMIKSNLTLVSSGKMGHSAIISLICNDSVAENETTFTYINTTNDPSDTYYLALSSKCCCPGKCGSPPALPPTQPAGNKSPSSEPLKTWQIILIVFGAILLLLLVIGTVYCCRKRSGYEPI